jgi:hypothetical protein
MSQNDLRHHTSMLLGTLHNQFGGRFDPKFVDAVGRSHFERLYRDATVLDYIPVLVYRSTRDDLRSIRDAELVQSA